MLTLIANLGSTSFKYKLYEMPLAASLGQERVVATGSSDRIGQGQSNTVVSDGKQSIESKIDLADHAAAIDLHLQELLKLKRSAPSVMYKPSATKQCMADLSAAR